MTQDRFFELVAQLGNTQEEQADALGVTRRSIIRWSQGARVPTTVSRLAWMLVKHGTPKNVKEW